MANANNDTRRDFLKKMGVGGALAALGTLPVLSLAADAAPKKKAKKGLALNLGLQEQILRIFIQKNQPSFQHTRRIKLSMIIL